MAVVSEDRWTCPACLRTTVVDGSEPDIRAALDAVRTRHGKGHDGRDITHGPEVIAALGLPEPRTAARRTPKGRRNQATTHRP